MRAVVAVGCLYELAALPDASPLPTISRIVNELNSRKITRVLAWAWSGGWAWHFMVRDSGMVPDEQ